MPEVMVLQHAACEDSGLIERAIEHKGLRTDTSAYSKDSQSRNSSTRRVLTENQAFRYSANVYTLLFHLEVTESRAC